MNFSQIALQLTGSVTSSLLTLVGPPVAELGVGGVIGWAIGKTVKTLLKIILSIVVVLGGIFGAGFLWLENIGVVSGCTINYSNLSNVGSNAIAWGSAELGGLVTFAATISFVGTGFAAGLALGLKG